jgi:hypothetical protein
MIGLGGDSIISIVMGLNDESTMDESTMDESTMDESTMDESTMDESTMDESTMDESTMDESTTGTSVISIVIGSDIIIYQRTFIRKKKFPSPFPK